MDTGTFIAWNKARTETHTIPGVAKVNEYCVRLSDWVNGPKASMDWVLSCLKQPRGELEDSEVLALVQEANSSDPADGVLATSLDMAVSWFPDLGKFNAEKELERCIACKSCDRTDVGCGQECADSFRKELAKAEAMLEIRDTETMGYGVFVAPGCKLVEGQFIAEYLGQIIPRGRNGNSAYRFDCDGPLAKLCVIDAKDYGKLSRFVNHSCGSNTYPTLHRVGKVPMLLYKAKRDIEANEQVTVDYGWQYFKNRLCMCLEKADRKPHYPKPDGVEEEAPAGKW